MRLSDASPEEWDDAARSAYRRDTSSAEWQSALHTGNPETIAEYILRCVQRRDTAHVREACDVLGILAG